MSSIKKIFQMDSFRKGIFTSSALGMVAKVLNFGSNLFLAYYFGTSIGVDIYLLVFSCFVLFSTILSNFCVTFIIPESMRLREQESNEKSMAFLNFFLFGFVVVSIAFSVFVFFFPFRFYSLVSQFSVETLKAHQSLLFYSIPLFALSSLSLYLVNILSSYRFFVIPVLTTIFISVLSLLSLFFLHKMQGVNSLLIGNLIAYTLQVFFLLYLMKDSLHWKFHLQKIHLTPDHLGSLFLIFVGNISTAFAAYIPLYLISRFGNGFISAMSYGQKVANLPMLIVVSQFSEVAAIKFNELASQNRPEEVNRIFVMTGKILLFLLLPFSFVMFVLSEEIIAFLFQRGKFTYESVVSSSLFFKYLGLALVPLAFHTIINRVFMAHQKTKQGVWYQILSNLVLALCLYVVVHFWNPYALPKMFALFHFSTLFFFYFYLRYFFPFIQYTQVVKYGVFLFLLHATLSANLLLFVTFLKKHAFSTGFQIITGCALYGIILLFINWKWKLNSDVNDLFLKLLNRLKRKTQKG